jgi:hypothetical protein
MSVGPLGGLAGSIAAPLAQAASSEVDRNHQAAGTQQRRLQNELRAESAGGIGEADGEDHEAGERDANGRRLWEAPPPGHKDASQQADDRQSKDVSRQSGNFVDLTG